MTKSQLTPGHIIECRNVFRAMLLPTGQFAGPTSFIHSYHLTDDLVCTDSDEYTVVKVYTPTDTFVLNELSNNTRLTLVWERQEFKYPLYCKGLIYSANCTERYEYVVEFTSLSAGTVVFSDVPEVYHLDYTTVGHTASNWPSHTDENWEIVDAPVTPTQPSLEDICEKLGIVIIGEFKPSAKQNIANELSKLLEE